MTEFWAEMGQLNALFQGQVNPEEQKKLYLETSGRSGEIFKPAEVVKLEQLEAQNAAGGNPASQPIQGKGADAQKKALMGYA